MTPAATAARYPFPAFPAGWFAVAYSDELRVSQVKPLSVLGRELVLFRGEDGVARVFDAWCPHLGAHLGHGGTVVGSGIQCPFHRWTYDGEGRCTSIPYSKKVIPGKARVDAFPVREVNRAIFVWHHPEGAAPTWELPVVPEALDPAWTRWRSIDREAQFHCQEIRENGVDAAHFDAVHDFPVTAFAVDAEGPVFHQRSQLSAQLGAQASAEALLTVDYHGLGYGVARQRIGEIEVLVLSHVTPLDEVSTRLRFAVSLRRLPSFAAARSLVAHIRQAGGQQGLAGVMARQLRGSGAGCRLSKVRGADKALARVGGPGAWLRELITRAIAMPAAAEVARQLDQDIYITERKRYLTRPLLRDGEQTISALRDWAQQFYPGAGSRRASLPQVAPGSAPALA